VAFERTTLVRHREPPRARTEIREVKKNAVLVDDHPAMRLAVRHILERDGRYEVQGEAASLGAAWSLIARLRPALLVLDLDLPDGSGLDLIERARHDCARMALLVVSAQNESLYAARARELGADGFVSKCRKLDTLTLALASLEAGYSFFPTLAEPHGETHRPGHALSHRELTVMEMLAAGRSHQQISEALNINVKTVSTYKVRVLRKLGLSSLVDLIDYARWKL
jgi:DNA-binding NarL/FixJ family response regulator